MDFLNSTIELKIEMAENLSPWDWNNQVLSYSFMFDKTIIPTPAGNPTQLTVQYYYVLTEVLFQRLLSTPWFMVGGTSFCLPLCLLRVIQTWNHSKWWVGEMDVVGLCVANEWHCCLAYEVISWPWRKVQISDINEWLDSKSTRVELFHRFWRRENYCIFYGSQDRRWWVSADFTFLDHLTGSWMIVVLLLRYFLCQTPFVIRASPRNPNTGHRTSGSPEFWLTKYCSMAYLG